MTLGPDDVRPERNPAHMTVPCDVCGVDVNIWIASTCSHCSFDGCDTCYAGHNCNSFDPRMVTHADQPKGTT